MASEFTPYINEININNVRLQIAKKKLHIPYLATTNQSTQVMTDYDTFPYFRYFRGIPESSQPIVAEREAGWRMRNDNCYKVQKTSNNQPSYPNHCFETACSTVFPCYPEHRSELNNSESLNTRFNKDCIVYYR